VPRPPGRRSLGRLDRHRPSWAARGGASHDARHIPGARGLECARGVCEAHRPVRHPIGHARPTGRLWPRGSGEGSHDPRTARHRSRCRHRTGWPPAGRPAPSGTRLEARAFWRKRRLAPSAN
jgi:hypothetical protein